MNIAENIKKLRTENGLTQSELSDICGFSMNAIYNYENNKRTPILENVIILADLFGITLDELVKGEF